MQGQALPGFRDFYPEELALRNHIFANWREVARRYGFQEYDGPPLEPLELYTEKSGEEIVQQLYAFEDKGGRKVALRPEMTPTLARLEGVRSEEHTSELQSLAYLVCRLLLEKKKKKMNNTFVVKTSISVRNCC